jgi:hypothetical protein
VQAGPPETCLLKLQEEVLAEKWSKGAASSNGLVLSYDFSPSKLQGEPGTQVALTAGRFCTADPLASAASRADTLSPSEALLLLCGRVSEPSSLQ